mmetsp:Transcript_101596/g.326506  ORF Transcript_101596/g.326506 Transcript_101596/m.326506 type:complete len:256 (-) Transcript_101596:221-988(-)
MQMIRAVLAASALLFAAATASSAADLPADAFNVGLSMDLKLADESVLGLQRSARLTRAGAVGFVEEMPRSQVLAREGLSFADVSVLGLQRSAKVVKGGAKVVESSPVPAMQGLSFVDVSALGLQRSAKVVKRGAKVVVSDEALAKEAPSFADVSVLGLQRSVKVVKGAQVEGSSEALAKEVPSFADITNGSPTLSDFSVLGFQRSATVVRRGAKAAREASTSRPDDSAREPALLGRGSRRGDVVASARDESSTKV